VPLVVLLLLLLLLPLPLKRSQVDVPTLRMDSASGVLFNNNDR